MDSDTILDKYEKLKTVISSYSRAGVAFSGGVDSSLLLYAASESLGKENVIALHGKSCLNSSHICIEDFFEKYFSKSAKLKIFQLDPLGSPEFRHAGKKRCYVCKKQIYSLFLQFLNETGGYTLLDGTNLDDAQEHRPGHIAIAELSVKSPLLEAGIDKKAVRFLAALKKLPNYSMPSNSCLATRLELPTSLNEHELSRVDSIEICLRAWGFDGCRAKPWSNTIVIEIREQDFNKFSQKFNRMRIEELCRKHGFEKIYVNLVGR